MNRESLRTFRRDSRTIVRELGFMQESWAPAKVTHAQVHILLELGSAGRLRPSELADRLRTDLALVSRNTRVLTNEQLIRTEPDPTDGRQRLHSLTEAGATVLRDIHTAADAEVCRAFEVLGPGEDAVVIAGMAAYAKALRRARLQEGLVLRPIQSYDDAAVKALIRTVMPQFETRGPGSSILDPEVDAMAAAYAAPRSAYLVVDSDNGIVGAGGFAPLIGGPATTCELRKMVFYDHARGLGMGARLLRQLLEEATKAGFERCYLETVTSMSRARRLFEQFGFEPLTQPEGDTGHFNCDAWYARPLR